MSTSNQEEVQDSTRTDSREPSVIEAMDAFSADVGHRAGELGNQFSLWFNQATHTTTTNNTTTSAAAAGEKMQELAQNTKDLGNQLSSWFSSAKEKMQETVTGLEHEFNTVLTKSAAQEKEQVQDDGEGSGLGPWSNLGLNEEEEALVKAQIISLSANNRNFQAKPPEDSNYNFVYNKEMIQKATVCLECDERLRKKRYEFVPKKMSEEDFWHSYFYRIHLIVLQATTDNPKSESSNKEIGNPNHDDGEEAHDHSDSDFDLGDFGNTEPIAQDGARETDLNLPDDDVTQQEDVADSLLDDLDKELADMQLHDDEELL